MVHFSASYVRLPERKPFKDVLNKNGPNPVGSNPCHWRVVALQQMPRLWPCFARLLKKADTRIPACSSCILPEIRLQHQLPTHPSQDAHQDDMCFFLTWQIPKAFYPFWPCHETSIVGNRCFFCWRRVSPLFTIWRDRIPRQKLIGPDQSLYPFSTMW